MMAMLSSNIGMMDAADIHDDVSPKKVLLREAEIYRQASEQNRDLAHHHQSLVSKKLADADRCERIARDLEEAAAKLG